MNTVDRQRFEKMVKDAAKDRKACLEEKRNLMVEMRPEFEQAFKNSMSFSSKVLNDDLISHSGEREGLQSHEVLDEAQEN